MVIRSSSLSRARIGQAIWKRLTDRCSVPASDSRCLAIPAIESTVSLTCALLVAMAPTFCDISLLVLLCSRAGEP